MIDIYKQVLVGQYPLPSSDTSNLLDDADIRKAAEEADKKADAKASNKKDEKPLQRKLRHQKKIKRTLLMKAKRQMTSPLIPMLLSTETDRQP